MITLRLPGTIPAAVARALNAALRQAHEAGLDHRRAQKVFFAKFDAAFDQMLTGPRYLKNEQLADVRAQAPRAGLAARFQAWPYMLDI